MTYAGWELPTPHCRRIAVGKGIDRAHGKSEVRPKVRKIITWEVGADRRPGGGRTDGRNRRSRVEGAGSLLSLAVWNLRNLGERECIEVHSEFCLTMGGTTVCNGPTRLVEANRRGADSVEVLSALDARNKTPTLFAPLWSASTSRVGPLQKAVSPTVKQNSECTSIHSHAPRFMMLHTARDSRDAALSPRDLLCQSEMSRGEDHEDESKN